MIFCTNCGNALKEGVRFCSKCGAAAEVGGQASPLSPQVGEKKQGRGGKVAITVVIILLLIIAAAALYGYFHGFDSLPLIGMYFAMDESEAVAESDVTPELTASQEVTTSGDSGREDGGDDSQEAGIPTYINAADGNNDTPSEMSMLPIVALDWEGLYRQFIADYVGQPEWFHRITLWDLNNDGIPELFLGYWSGHGVYTIVDDEVIEVGWTYARSPYDLYCLLYVIEGYDGIYTNIEDAHTDDGGSLYFEMSGNSLKNIGMEDGVNIVDIYQHTDVGDPPDYPMHTSYYSRGELVSFEEYERMLNRYFNSENQVKEYDYSPWNGVAYVVDEASMDAMFSEYLAE